MKRLSREQKNYWKVIGIKRFQRRLLEKHKRNLKNKKLDPNALRLMLVAPPVLCIGDPIHRQKLLCFLSKLRTHTLIRKKPVQIDFRKTIKTISCGTLLFLAEIDRICRLTTGSHLISCCLPKDKIVLQVFDQVGILQLLGRAQPRDRREYDVSVRHWHFASGVQSDGARLDPLLDDIEGKVTPVLKTSIYKGVTEAMTNSVHHAYLEGRNDGVQRPNDKRWWMFSQEKDGRLTVILCDLGIGIPRSLPRNEDAAFTWPERLTNFISPFKKYMREPALIKAALEIGKSRTNEPNRGKGLPQIIDVVKSSSSGVVAIHSNAGRYTLKTGANEAMKQYKDSIMGTLIEWSVPIEAQD